MASKKEGRRLFQFFPVVVGLRNNACAKNGGCNDSRKKRKNRRVEKSPGKV